MKEFEKWYKNNHRDVWLSRSTKRVAAEDGWKAALEWVLNDSVPNSYILSQIEEELNEKNNNN